MSFWHAFISVRILLVLHSLFILMMLQGIWPQYFHVAIFICNLFSLNFSKEMWFRIIFLISQSFLICCFHVHHKCGGLLFEILLALVSAPSRHTHTFFWIFSFDSLPRSFSSVWGPVLGGNFGWLPLRVHVAQMAQGTPASCTRWCLVVMALPDLSAAQPDLLCFPVSSWWLFRVPLILRSIDTPFLSFAASVQSLIHWGLRALVPDLPLKMWGF